MKSKKVYKTKQVYVLQGFYGEGGWDDLCQYSKNEYAEAKRDLVDYMRNTPEYLYRIIRRRVPNPEYHQCVQD